MNQGHLCSPSSPHAPDLLRRFARLLRQLRVAPGAVQRAAMPAPGGRKPEGNHGLEIRPPSPSVPELFQLRSDMAKHHRRIEKMLAEVLGKIQVATSKAIRDELGTMKKQLTREEPDICIPGTPDRVFEEDQAELAASDDDRPAKKEMGLLRRQASARDKFEKSPVSTLEAWAGGSGPGSPVNAGNTVTMSTSDIEGEDAKKKFKLEKTKVKGVRDILEMKWKSQSSSEVGRCRSAAKLIVGNPKFEWSCATLILLCAILIGVEAHWSMVNIGSTPPLVFRIFNSVFNGLFTIELCLRLAVDGLYFWTLRNSSIHWNALDTVLVLLALVEEVLVLVWTTESQLSGLKILRMVRLARILRIVRVVRFFSELRVMVNGVIGSAKSLCWALLLLLLVNFLFGVVFMQLSMEYLETINPQAELRQYFGSLPRTMLTLYQAISGGIDWYNAIVTLLPVSEWMEYIFSAYVFFTVFCCLNIVTGIFVDNAKALKVADEEAMHHEAMKERQKWISEVAELFTKICAEKDGKLTKEDFVHHVTHSDRIATCFYHLGINTETTNTDELWELFDVDDSGGIDQDEFAIGIKQFHGYARSIDLFKLRKEVKEILKNLALFVHDDH
ncbi:unnamed protein product [Effrenium voratum]|nr:unnamed protein product [Effrenium voratum]